MGTRTVRLESADLFRRKIFAAGCAGTNGYRLLIFREAIARDFYLIVAGRKIVELIVAGLISLDASSGYRHRGACDWPAIRSVKHLASE